MITLPVNATNRDKYVPAMNVQTEAEATEWMKICVKHRIDNFGGSYEEAEGHEREAIAHAAYYGFKENNETIERVARLFHIEVEMKRMEHLLD